MPQAMHPETIDLHMTGLSRELAFLKEFSFYLAGGTGLSLQTGHRKSFDFDKYVFRDIYWDKDKNLKSTLFIGSASSLPVTPLSEVKDFEGNILYKVVGIK